MTEKKERPGDLVREEPRPRRPREPPDETEELPEAALDAEPIPVAPPRIRDPADRAHDDWTPDEAIAELDQLQSELERLRRPRRPPDA